MAVRACTVGCPKPTASNVPCGILLRVTDDPFFTELGRRIRDVRVHDGYVVEDGTNAGIVGVVPMFE